MSAQAAESATSPIIGSIKYVGFDGMDQAGRPICLKCEADKLKEIEAKQATEERRQRARDYMARLQGNGPKQDTAPEQSDGVETTVALAIAPDENPLPSAAIMIDLGETPLRASLQ